MILSMAPAGKCDLIPHTTQLHVRDRHRGAIMGPCQRGLLRSKQDGVRSEPMCSWMVQQKGAEVRVRT